MAEVVGLWLQEPSDEVPDVVTERFECPTCGSTFGPMRHQGTLRVSVTLTCCGVVVEVVSSAQ